MLCNNTSLTQGERPEEGEFMKSGLCFKVTVNHCVKCGKRSNVSYIDDNEAHLSISFRYLHCRKHKRGKSTVLGIVGSIIVELSTILLKDFIKIVLKVCKASQ